MAPKRSASSAKLRNAKPGKGSRPAQDANPKLVRGAEGFPYLVVGIGASAGGLDALLKFFHSVPSGCGMVFIVVQHLDPSRPSSMTELLQGHTELKVVAAQDGMQVEPNHIYMIQPDRYLTIENHTLHQTQPAEPRGMRLSVDVLFHSMARDLKECAVGIILSGTGSDGSLGLRAIKESGGLTLVQDPATAEFDGMPRSAILTGVVDAVLPVAQMIGVIHGFASHAYIRTPESAADGGSDFVTGVLALLNVRRNMDFSSYKKGTINRRILRRMGLLQIDSGADYLRLLREDADELTALHNDLLIQVTRFFREPEAWQALSREILPLILAEASRDNPVRVWTPGCATGEEAYSLGMLLTEAREASGSNIPIQIFASDLDRTALDLARAGTYPENIVADVSEDRLRRFFVRQEHQFSEPATAGRHRVRPA
ncbi:MAG: chemotaxis protein CheB [Gemmatimonadota bacterium]